MGLREQIEAIAKDRDVDLIGFASVDDIELAYPPRPAEDLLPGAKTVIALAGALLWGALNCPRGTKGAIKDAQDAYERIQGTALAIGRFLESKGFASYAPPASMPADVYKHEGVYHFAAEWSHRQAAIASGLGVKGMNNLLVTPEYGPRVRLGGMITTAEIEPSKREMPEDLCNGCMKCVKICPVNALKSDADVSQRLVQPKCKTHYVRPFLDHTPWQTIKNIFTVEGWPISAVQSLTEGYHFSCAECQRVCPVGKLGKRE